MYLPDRFYLRVRDKEITHGIMHGILPVVVALILHAAISLGRLALHSWWQALVVLTVAYSQFHTKSAMVCLCWGE